MILKSLISILKGGPGSGFHGHSGRPGERGGSSSEGGVTNGDKDRTKTRQLISESDKRMRQAGRYFNEMQSQRAIDELDHAASSVSELVDSSVNIVPEQNWNNANRYFGEGSRLIGIASEKGTPGDQVRTLRQAREFLERAVREIEEHGGD